MLQRNNNRAFPLVEGRNGGTRALLIVVEMKVLRRYLLGWVGWNLWRSCNKMIWKSLLPEYAKRDIILVDYNMWGYLNDIFWKPFLCKWKVWLWFHYQPGDIWAGSCEAYGKSYSKDLIVILNLVSGDGIFIKLDRMIKIRRTEPGLNCRGGPWTQK